MSNIAVPELRRYTAGNILELIVLLAYQVIVAVVVVFVMKGALPRVVAGSSHIFLQTASLMHGVIASILK